jgi:hypothetical protein
MTDAAIDNPPVAPRKRPSPASILLPPLLMLGAMIMAADIAAVALRPLKALQIPYLKWMDYSPFIFPGACAVLWLLTARKWGNAGGVVAVLLCFALVSFIPRYAESRVAKLQVTHWIDSDDLKSIETRLGVPVFEQGSREGTFVVVAPENEQRVRAELIRLQILGRSPAD